MQTSATCTAQRSKGIDLPAHLVDRNVLRHALPPVRRKGQIKAETETPPYKLYQERAFFDLIWQRRVQRGATAPRWGYLAGYLEDQGVGPAVAPRGGAQCWYHTPYPTSVPHWA
eukprot:3940676-Rhodomonas_salina.1